MKELSRRVFLVSLKWPKLFSALLVLTTIFLSSHIKDITVDTSVYNLIQKDTEDYEYLKKSQKIFGSENITTIIFQGDDLFTSETLVKVSDAVYEVDELQDVERVDSLFTSPAPRSIDEMIHTSPLFDDIPEEDNQINELISQAKKNPMFLHHLISKDSKSMSVNVYAHQSVSGTKAYHKFAKEIEKKLEPLRPYIANIIQMGPPAYHVENVKMLISNQKVIIPLSLFIIFLCLYFGARNLNGALVPLLTGVLSIIWTIGLMGLLGIPIQVMTSTVPLLLVIIGSTEDTHIISTFVQRRKKGYSKTNAINLCARKLGLPLALTSLTTILGFSTIFINVIPALKEFAIVAAAGMLFNFIITIGIVPLYLMKFSSNQSTEKAPSFIDQLISKCEEVIHILIRKHQKKILFFTLLFSTIALLPINQIYTDNNFIRQLKEKTPLRQKVEFINSIFKGESTAFVIFESKQDEAFKKPKNLDLVFKAHNLINKNKGIGVAQSFAGLMSHQNRVMHEQRDSFYKVPESKELMAQYLLSFNRDQLKPFVSADFKKTNIIFKYFTPSTAETMNLIDDLQMKIEQLLKGSDITVRFTSKRLLADKASKTIVKSQVQSILIIIFIVFLLMSSFFKSLKIGLISLVPNIVPILGLFGALAYLKIPLDLGTCNIAAIAFGICVDDTLHFLIKYHNEMKISHDKSKALAKTIHYEVRPIIITSLSIILGLSFLVFSDFTMITEFGLLMSFVMLLALISDLIITPTLIDLFD